MKKRILAMVLSVMMLLCVTLAQAETATTKITFMGWGTDKEIAAFNAMIDQFEQAYPGVEVEYIVVADNEFDTKLQTMIGSGECPDVFYCSIDKMMKYAITGNLYDMTLSLIHISEPTRQAEISYAVFCLKKKNSTFDASF